ncbi:alcohol oxidase [Microthyrium microscopicum]|uniref:Alcohol oxidase n=1 Tax=Microthyrium microscopicum TaxID=703497 RepID=A0A6A6UIT5_9PEZI|nr:alcohol oxidase [Microthyrium microscopicum]
MTPETDITKYDFIVVGSGPAGCILARRLADTPKKPSVLLLEAGTSECDPASLIVADRYDILTKYPEYNWNYRTVPQKALDNRILDCSRGKGLGGSSKINFACYTIGPKGDYDHWAKIVDDDFFNWENTRRRFQGIENYDTNVAPEYQQFANPGLHQHGNADGVYVYFPKTWEPGLTSMFAAAANCGISTNLDINSGDPIGLGMCPTAGKTGYRATGATVFLHNHPSNLTILSDTQVTGLILVGLRAIGVEADDKKYLARKEVILCAGAIDTPKLLMLSGIGPKAELDKHSIPIVKDLPGVGSNLEDHWLVPFVIQLKSSIPNPRLFITDPRAYAEAQARFNTNGTGPLASLHGCMPMGFLRPSAAMVNSEEYKSLQADVKERLKQSTVPTWEITTHTPPLIPDAIPKLHYLTALIIGHVPQSRGSIRLASTNPYDPPLCDPRILDHPFDQRNLIESARIVQEIFSDPSLQDDIEAALAAPKSSSEEDILAYGRQVAVTDWHPSCTARMGTDDDPMAVVDTHFRVKGIEALRVADMSVTPFLPSCHPMAVAYLIGDMCKERLALEYRLNIQ